MHARTCAERLDTIYVFAIDSLRTAETARSMVKDPEISHISRGARAGASFGQHRSWSFFLVLFLFCAGCSKVRDSHELLHSLLWMHTSAEYHTLSVMTYQQAGDALDRALLDRRATASLEQTGDFQHLPPAVILDLDETVLDNSPFEARLMAQRTAFNQPMWEQWVQEASAQAVPGVLDFIAAARKKGVTVFFVSNRRAHQESSTRRNFEKLGIPLPTDLDTLLLEGESPFRWPPNKSSRRRYLAERYRILLLIGDDLGDFVDGARDKPEQRIALAGQHDHRWGRSWFLLPNPMYGTWETSLTPPGLTEAQKLSFKLLLLQDAP